MRKSGLQGWLIRIRSWVLVLAALLFVAGPMADSLVCAADDIPAPAAAGKIQAAAVQPVHATFEHRTAGEAPGTCPHGHVHAAMSVVDLQAPSAAPVSRPSAVVRPMSSRVPPSIVGPGFDRPPRA